MFVWGQSIGWSSVVNPQLRRSDIGLGLDDEGSSWVGSSLAIGGFVGGLMGGESDVFLPVIVKVFWVIQ
jgi:hypothetical protein